MRPVARYQFLHELLQRLEEALGTAHPLLDSLFGGKLAQQMLWNDPTTGDPHTSEHAEPFRVLQLEIQGCTSVEEALNAYVEGEVIHGYALPDGAKVDAHKRCCLGTLPQTLIIQLKRFEFDLVRPRRRPPRHLPRHPPLPPPLHPPILAVREVARP